MPKKCKWNSLEQVIFCEWCCVSVVFWYPKYTFFSYICNCKVNQYSAYITYTLNTPYHKIKSLLIEVIDRKILYLDTKFWSKLRKIACKQRKWRILQLGVVKITQWMYVYGWTIQSTIPIKGKYRFNRNFWELSWHFLNLCELFLWLVKWLYFKICHHTLNFSNSIKIKLSV